MSQKETSPVQKNTGGDDVLEAVGRLGQRVEKVENKVEEVKEDVIELKVENEKMKANQERFSAEFSTHYKFIGQAVDKISNTLEKVVEMQQSHEKEMMVLKYEQRINDMKQDDRVNNQVKTLESNFEKNGFWTRLGNNISKELEKNFIKYIITAIGAGTIYMIAQSLGIELVIK